MNNNIIHLLLWIYRNLKRSGLLNYSWTESTFISSYFFYKKYLEDAMAKLVKNYPMFFQQGHILDIGANIGYTAYVFSKALSSPYQVFAFEPEEYNLNLLKKVVQKFGLSDKLVITAAAVGDRVGEIELWRNENHHADHRVLTEELRKQINRNSFIQKTPLITIDNFLQKQNVVENIAFIKIDVQGYELAVCEGMQQTLISNQDCKIVLEYCPSMMVELGFDPKKIIDFFLKKNYLLYTFNKKGMLSHLNLNYLESNATQKTPCVYFDILCSKTPITI